MAKNPPEGSPNIFPALRYKNAAAALEWLGRAFGFEKQMVVPGPEGTIAHAQMKLGPGVIMLGSGKHGPGTDNPWNTVKQGVYVYVEDVDVHSLLHGVPGVVGAGPVLSRPEHDHAGAELHLRVGDGPLGPRHHHLLLEAEGPAEPLESGGRVLVSQSGEDVRAPLRWVLGHVIRASFLSSTWAMSAVQGSEALLHLLGRHVLPVCRDHPDVSEGVRQGARPVAVELILHRPH